MREITIRPVDGSGWMVEVEGVRNAQIFRSGASAETAAKALAERLAEDGEPIELSIFLRDGALAARFVAAAR